MLWLCIPPAGSFMAQVLDLTCHEAPVPSDRAQVLATCLLLLPCRTQASLWSPFLWRGHHETECSKMACDEEPLPPAGRVAWVRRAVW